MILGSIKIIWAIIFFLVCGFGLKAQELIRLSSNINTDEDEFLPCFVDGTLYFGRTYLVGNSPIQQFQVYKSKDKKAELQYNSEYALLSSDLNKFSLSLTQLVERKPEFHRFFMYAITKNENRRTHFFGKSTKYHDFHPTLSPDGTYIVFVSDRPGGIGESDTTTDLYICFKLSDGIWSEPYNLGTEINSENNEISPFIDKENNLYFSSKRLINGTWNYDIFKAQPVGKGKWTNPIALGYSINTEFNETGALLVGDSLFFSSDRQRGTNNPSKLSNYDLYCFIQPKARIGDNEPNIEVTLNIEKQRSFSIDFSQYKVPFFVTGFYLPNTSENLEYLKKCFRTGVYGTNPQTRHISNPDLEPLDYDFFAEIVDVAIEDAVKQSMEMLKNIEENSNSVIEITFTGYADSRPIFNDAIYDGENIRSSNPLFTVDYADKLDNTLLSKLRAFYTSQLFIKKMGESYVFRKLKDRMIFKIKGNGSDLFSELPDFEKRRVIITMNLETRINQYRSLESQLE